MKIDRFNPKLGGLVFFPERSMVWGKIPKVAGTSLLAFFRSRLGRAVYFKQSPREYMRLCEADLSNWLRFVFVRNPYDRFASFWRYARESRMAEPGETFGKFVREFPGRYGTNRTFAKHGRPSADWIDFLDPNFVGRFENLRNDVRSLLAKRKQTILPTESLPRLNVSRGSVDLVELYKSTLIAAPFVESFYGRDFGKLYSLGEWNGEENAI